MPRLAGRGRCHLRTSTPHPVVDIHSHILPGLDDGAKHIDESIEMCRLAAADGISVIVATPHAHDGVHTTHRTSLLLERVSELNDRVGGRPAVQLGCELRLTHDVVKLVRSGETAPTVAGGPYVLIEFPHSLVPPGSDRVLFDLISSGFRPIIAHPERNLLLMSEPARFHQMVERGVLGQVDAGSITGQFGKRVQQTARIMLECGLIHVIASDCHNTRNRLPGMSPAVEAAAEIVGGEYANAMAKDNPRAVVEGEIIPSRPNPTLPQRRKRWLLF